MAGAYTYLSDCYKRTYGTDVAGVARRLGYPESTCAAVDDTVEYPGSFMRLYPDTYASIQSCKHQMDKRSEREYAKDIVASWTAESLIVNRLRKAGVNVVLSGSDAERKILSNTSVQSSSDMTVVINGQSKKVELICDYTGFWSRTGKLHLRDNKLHQLAAADALVLAIDCTAKRYYLFAASAVEASSAVTYLDRHPVWGKPAAEIDLAADQELIMTGKDTGTEMAAALRKKIVDNFAAHSNICIDKTLNRSYTICSANEVRRAQFIPFIPAEFRGSNKSAAIKN